MDQELVRDHAIEGGLPGKPPLQPQPAQPIKFGLSDYVDRISTFTLANLLWVLLSLPLVTMPIATAGLFATFSLWVRGKDMELFATFFGAMRRYWWKSLLIGGLDLIVGVVVVIDLLTFPRIGWSPPALLISQSVVLGFGMISLLVNMYLWPLMVVFTMPLKAVVVTAARLAIGHLGWSLLILILVCVPVAVSLFVPALFTIFATFSACALLINWGAWRVIRRYVAADELATLESRRQPQLKT